MVVLIGFIDLGCSATFIAKICVAVPPHCLQGYSTLFLSRPNTSSFNWTPFGRSIKEASVASNTEQNNHPKGYGNFIVGADPFI
jgi:hypothetical protein